MHRTARPRTRRCSRDLAVWPPGALSSAASQSAKRTSIQVRGSRVGPTQRLSPSPTYWTIPPKVWPGRSGRAAKQGSAAAEAVASKQAATPMPAQPGFTADLRTRKQFGRQLLVEFSETVSPVADERPAKSDGAQAKERRVAHPASAPCWADVALAWLISGDQTVSAVEGKVCAPGFGAGSATVSTP